MYDINLPFPPDSNIVFCASLCAICKLLYPLGVAMDGYILHHFRLGRNIYGKGHQAKYWKSELHIERWQKE